MCVPLVFFLSTIVLHSVSAGGVYCAKTARARAAALGLDYPGVHGAPVLHGPAAYMRHPSTIPLRHYLYKNNDPELAEPNTAYYKQKYPGVRFLDDGAHKQAHPQGSESTLQLSHGTYNPVQSEYATEQVLNLPRGQPVSNRESNFDEVKHVAPPTWAAAPQLLPFVYNEHDDVFDEPVPNRHAMSLSGLPLPQSRGYGAYQRGLTEYGLEREVPVLGPSDFNNQPHITAMSRRGPMFVRWPRTWFPAPHAQPLQRGLIVKQLIQGYPFPRQ